MSARSHDEYQENIGAYVLGALPELEHEVLERHIAGCESCRAEAERLAPVTDVLARSVPQVMPPASLKASLMETVRAEAQARTADERARRLRRSWWPAGVQPRIAARGALALVAVGVVIGVAATQFSDNGPGTRTITAQQVNRAAMPSGSAALELTNDDRSGRVRLNGAPPPPSGREYQLWIQRGKTIERGPAFTVGADGDATQSLPGDLRNADAVMVTIERAGGAPAPTSKPIMQFPV
jgi:anti-sigma-K factor RskA